MAGTGAVQNLFDPGAVAETDWRARGIDGQLPGEVARDLLLVLKQQLFKFANISELPTVRQLTGRIHRRTCKERNFLPIFSMAWCRTPVAQGAVTVAPAAEHVEVFQRKPSRVHFRVTGRATLLAAMLLELLAACHRP